MKVQIDVFFDSTPSFLHNPTIFARFLANLSLFWANLSRFRPFWRNFAGFARILGQLAAAEGAAGVYASLTSFALQEQGIRQTPSNWLSLVTVIEKQWSKR